MKDFGITIVSLIEPKDRQLDDTSKGVLSYTARLASQLKCPWQAAAIRELDEGELEKAGQYGTPSISCLQKVWECSERPEHSAFLLFTFLKNFQLPLVLLPHNDLGTTLAPILAALLDGAIAAEVREIEDVDEGLLLSQNSVGTKIREKRLWDGKRPLILTVPLSVLSDVEVPPARQRKTVIETWDTDVDCSLSASEIIRRIPADPTTVDLTEAETIFCAGKGCSEENVEQLRELCRLLGVSFGVTRPVYDLGWEDFSRMIGQTGKTVKPKLYVSFGVSGSMHHVGGIKDSEKIVAVNIDAKAPIYSNSDEGFVADVDQVLPLMLDAVKRLQGGA